MGPLIEQVLATGLALFFEQFAQLGIRSIYLSIYLFKSLGAVRH
tara:strand:- start:177 stop:308 length:132 start_codon:yes stop_codon:yes gene_type:complete